MYVLYNIFKFVGNNSYIKNVYIYNMVLSPLNAGFDISFVTSYKTLFEVILINIL